MEVTCNRCHQPVLAGTRYCPYCGLPQIVYDAEAAVTDGSEPVRWDEAVRDASSVAWKPALRSIFRLALPAGVLCAYLWPMGIFGMVLMGFTGAWAVSLYVRSQRPAWITLGAGARIGLAAGIVATWTAAATTGATVFAMRYWFHRGAIFDNFWNHLVEVDFTRQWNAMGADTQTIAALKSMLLSPDGRAAWILCTIAFLIAVSLVFAVAGAALSARLQVKRRGPQL